MTEKEVKTLAPLKKPVNLKEWKDHVMTNIDHSIEPEVAKKLKEGHYYAQYAAYDFCGYVWKQDNKWACEIWKYHSHIETLVADTLEEIMDDACSQYGSD